MTDKHGTDREWDAGAYDTLNGPMTERGNDAVARLELRGDETVLDAGCGTGQVTATLLERLPRGRVVALDGSTAMLDGRARALRRRSARDVRARRPRAAAAGRGRRSVDAIVSTSTLALGRATTTRCSATWPRCCGRAGSSSSTAAAPAT